MRWTPADDAAFRAHTARRSRQEQETLAQVLDHLLTHDFAPGIVSTTGDGWGIALPLDGWYTDREGAESAADYWHDLFERVRALLAEERDRP